MKLDPRRTFKSGICELCPDTIYRCLKSWEDPSKRYYRKAVDFDSALPHSAVPCRSCYNTLVEHGNLQMYVDCTPDNIIEEDSRKPRYRQAHWELHDNQLGLYWVSFHPLLKEGFGIQPNAKALCGMTFHVKQCKKCKARHESANKTLDFLTNSNTRSRQATTSFFLLKNLL